MENKNASGFPISATAAASFLARIAGRWVNVPDTLLELATRRISHKTANYTVLATESGTLFTNFGATATITFTLPAAVVGLRYTFAVRASSGTSWQLRVDPNGSELLETAANPRVAGTAGQYTWADSIGENISICCLETGKWAVLTYEGTWTLV